MADAAAAGPEPAGKHPCTHPEFDAHVDVNRIEPDADGMPMAFVADIRVHCVQPPEGCGVAFEFVGLPAGLSYEHPRTSVDATELRAPIRPADGHPRPLPNVTGFSVHMHTPGGKVQL